MGGKCDPPGFESAGSHWNPSGARHGLEAPEGQHAGDMPNLVVKDDGKGTLAYELRGATFAGLLDADGSRSEEHTSELQSLMRISYAVFCLKKKTMHRSQTYRHYI